MCGLSWLWNWWENTSYYFNGTTKSIIFLGIDNAGKTTIQYALTSNYFFINKNPKDASNSFTLNNVHFFLKGFKVYRGIMYSYKQWIESSDCIIYVVDSGDHQRLEESKNELFNILSKYNLEDKPILIYANKQDLPHSLGIDELIEKLDLNNIPQSNSWLIQPCSVITKFGILEGIEWIIDGCPSNPKRFKTVKSAKSIMHSR